MLAGDPVRPAEKTPAARLLVVDDDVPLGSALVQMLRRLGFAADAVGNGRKALAHLSAHPVDLIISDIFMPDCDGLELLRELRHVHPRPQLLAMTGGGSRAMPDMLDVALQLGAARTIRKPFEPEDLLRQLREILTPGTATARPAAS